VKTPNNRILALALALTALLLDLSVFQTAHAGIWVTNGPMTTARYGHTATLLSDGRVLVAGGGGNSAELYDPATKAWTMTGLMSRPHSGTATLLRNGEVLVADVGADLYNPATRRWTATGDMVIGRSYPAAVLLPNGKVLVTGGVNLNAGGFLSSAELYDPATETWTATGGMTVPHSQHTATLLTNGLVLVAGGVGVRIAELYNPATGTWTATLSMNIARRLHTATLLPDGKVLVAGGSMVLARPFQAPRLMIRRQASGRRLGRWPRNVSITRRRYYPTARCWSPVET
jgi:hypothetical protein